MQNILGYYVFTTRDGGLWLDADEKRWTALFVEAAEFGSAELAAAIGARQETPDGTIYVFACMGVEP